MRIFSFLVVLLLFAALVSSQANSAPSPPSANKYLIIMAGKGLKPLFERKLSPEAEGLINNPDTYIVFGENNISLLPSLPAGWRVKPTLNFKSFREFQTAVKNGSIPASVKAVMYDNELWQKTPQEEKEKAVEYTQRFSDLAHAQNLVFINAPALGAYSDKYVRGVMPYIDIFVSQRQKAEGNTVKYEKKMEQMIQRAKKANPRIKVLAQLSTNPDIRGFSFKVLVQDIKNLKGKADGFLIYNGADSAKANQDFVDFVSTTLPQVLR